MLIATRASALPATPPTKLMPLYTKYIAKAAEIASAKSPIDSAWIGSFSITETADAARRTANPPKRNP